MFPRCTSAILAIVLMNAIEAQDLSILRAQYDWSVDPAWDPSWSVGIAAGPEILDETLSIRLRNIKPEFLSVFFERRRVIRFTDQASIRAFGHVSVPESLDPLADRQLSAPADPNGQPHPLWFNVRLDLFAARVVRPDGSWDELHVTGSVQRAKVRTPITNEEAWSYLLDVAGIRTGDVVEFRWKYMVPYDLNAPRSYGWRARYWVDNWSRLTSWRVFFHGTLPIRAQRTEIVYHRRQGLALMGWPATERHEEGDAIRCTWHMEDLPACMDEVNARPADLLPHIVVRLEPDDPRYWRRDHLSGIPVQQPYWMYVLREREDKALWWKQVARKNVPDHQNELLKDFIRSTTLGQEQEPVARRIERIHERIATRFTFEPDNAWYDNDHWTGRPRMGDQVNESRLRAISRYDLYAKIIDHYFVDYTSAYVLDARVGRMDDRYISPLWGNEFLLAVRDGDGLLWMHPKRSRSGLMANEFPFYWQGTSALLNNLALLVSDGPVLPVFTDLPIAPPHENVRTVHFEMEVDLAQRTVHARVRVLLTGQFSTLGRASYLFNEVDSTVLSAYGHRPDHSPHARLIDQRMAPLQTDPPFRQAIEMELDLSQALSATGEDTWQLDLSGLLEHALPEGFRAAGRDLPFHWDFAQRDELSIQVGFDRPVDVDLRSAIIGVDTCGSTQYRCNLDRIDERQVLLRSGLRVNDVIVPVERAAELQLLLEHGHAAARAVLAIRAAKPTDP
ncbi:MAG: hypothetical protein IPG10_17710 [Flavobacteriales bacterium]|nr:hypothetical protein [Flavobacteriales bacterium]